MNKITNPMVSKRHKRKRLTLLRAVTMTLFMALFTQIAQSQSVKLKMTNGTENVPADGFLFYDSGGPLLFTPGTPEAEEYNWTTWYQHNEEYTLTLTVPSGGIEIDFSKCLVNNDTLRFYEGNSVNPDNLIGEFCNNEYSTSFCSTSNHFKVVSHGNMTVRFISDYHWRDEGWEAIITRVADYTPQPPVAVMAACDNLVTLIPTSMGTDDDDTNDKIEYKIGDGSYTTYTPGGLIDLNSQSFPVTVTVKATVDGVASDEKAYTFSLKIQPPGVPTYTLNASSNSVTTYFPNKPEGVNDTYYIRWTIDNNPTATNAPSLWQQANHEFEQPNNTPNTVPAGDIDYTNVTLSTPFYIHIATRGTTCPDIFSTVVNIEVTARYVPMPTITFETSGDNGLTTLACSLTGATIYYTTDGSTPTTSSTQYNGSNFTVTAGTTVKAIAVKDGYTTSAVASAIFVPGAESGDPQSGTYGGVVLLDDREDHSWSYYSDGEQPIHSLNPADVKITYTGYGTNTMTSTSTAATGLTNTDFNANVSSSQVAVNVGGESENQFIYLKTLEKDQSTNNEYPYTMIPNPFQVRPAYSSRSNVANYDTDIMEMPRENRDETFTIGTGTNYSTGNTSSSNFTPGSVMGNTYYYYSTTQFIYTSSEMGDAKTLTSIGFYHNNAGTFNTTLSIYLAHTTSNTVATGSPATTGTLVYQKATTVGGTTAGWQTFTLDTPFEYDGTSNLLVIVCRGGSNYLTGQGWRYTSTSSNYRYLYRSADNSSYGDITNTSNYNSSYNRPNIQIGYTTASSGYCTPAFSNNTDYINSFTLGSISNTNSGFSSGGYGNFTSLSTSLQQGETATASLTSSSGSGTHAAAVWIDFNDNYTFESSERVGTQGNIGASSTVNINLTIPNDAAPGSHRMRVVYQYNVSATSIEPCASANYGEAEDYTVNITGGSTTGDWRGFYAWRVKSLSSGLEILRADGTQVLVGGYIDADEDIKFRTSNSEGNEVEFEALWAKANVVTCSSANGLSTAIASSSLNANYGYERNFVVVTNGAQTNAITNTSQKPVTITQLYPDGSGTMNSSRYLAGYFTANNDTKFENIYMQNGGMPYTEYTYTYYRMAYYSNTRYYYYSSTYGWYNGYNYGSSYATPYTFTSEDSSLNTNTNYDFGDGTISIDGYSCTILRQITNKTSSTQTTTSTDYYAQGNDLVFGRGITPVTTDGLCAGNIFGLNADATNPHFIMRFESGNFAYIYSMGYTASGHSVSGNPHVKVVLGSDYDRSTSANEILKITNHITGGSNIHFDSGNVTNINYDYIVKSGSVLSSVSVGDGEIENAFYLGGLSGQNVGTQYQGGRRLTIEGGVFKSIAGGYESYGDSNNEGVYIRMRGGEVLGSIYGAAAYAGAFGDREFIFTGGTVNGWIAGGCNGTETDGGYLDGDTYIYFGGKAICTSNGNSTLINSSRGGNIFGAGSGIAGGATVGQVNNSTVVVADAAEVEHNVYGGGNYGFIRPGTNHKSDIYILGGHVHESVFGGANQQEAQIVNIYMKDGIIDGNLYGGSNTKGSVRNESTVNISGGTVTNVFGGGCGQETKMMAGTHVIVSGGTIAENVFGGGELGIVMGNTNVNVSGGTMQNVFGAGKGGSTAANISGNTVVNISGGTISNVYGGGMSGDVTPLATLDDCVATFDGPLPDGWSNIDNDNDGHTWIIGEDSFMSYSYDNATNSALTPNNWIIMQKMVLGDYINFTAKAIDKNYPGDKVSVYVSTTNTNLSSFTQVGSSITAPATNTAYTIDLSSYNGQEGWIAFRHHDCTDLFGVNISNIVISKSFDAPSQDLTSTVTIQGGTIDEDVFGGGRLGKTDGDVVVNVLGGNIAGNVYGGAFGRRGEVFIAGTHTVNVTGGNLYGNVYGGSRNANDALTFNHTGYTMDQAVNHVNISGGHVYYQVFAGGYFGHTYGSVYAFIGQNAINNAPNAAPTDGVSYNAAALLIDGSVWAGADFGNFDGTEFGAATIEGYSNVYVDGEGYNTVSTQPSDAGYMNIGGSVLGCGTSCYAGIMGRDLILRNYGQPVENPNYNGKDDIIIEPYNTATRNMMSVQFFNTAIFDDIHIHLIGQGRINSLSSTEKYSIYEIADSVNVANGSSLFIDYPMDQVKKLGSYTCADVYADSPSFAVVNYTDLPTAGKDNKFRVNNGSYLNVKYIGAYNTGTNTGWDYGELEGFFYMMTEDENNTCAYARPKQSKDNGNQIPTTYDNPVDGGFLSYNSEYNIYTAGTLNGSNQFASVSDAPGTGDPAVQMAYENHTLNTKNGELYFRIWRYGGIYSYREGVFDAVASSAAGYSTADVVIALPASRGDGSYFRIKSVEGFPNIDYGTDVMTVNAGVYDATLSDGVHGTPTSTGWMYYDGTAFVEGQQQTSSNLTNALADLNANANVNFGLVAIPQGSLAGGSNVNWLICDAAADENEALATSTWVNNTQVTNPSILFRLTYNNGLDNNAIWDPIIITFEQCDAQGHVKDEITVALSVSISTTIDQSFGTQAYAIMNGQGGQADIYTAKVVLPGFIPWVNTEGDLSDWTFVSATWTPEGSEFTNAWKQGSNYVHDPAAINEFSMQIVPAANYDNTVGWASYDHTAKDLYYLQNGDPTAQEKHLAYTDARNPAAFDFILHYDGRATCDTKQKMGELVVTLHFTNINNGTTNHDQNLTITIEVWRRGAGANYYLDGVHGDNFYTGTNPNAAKKTLSGIFNRSDYLPGDNIFIVNTVTANGGSTLDWNGEVYDGVKIYRYPGGHPLDEDQTQAHSTETWDYEEYLEYNPGNKGFTGPLVVVEKSMAIHDIILDGAYNIAVGTPNTTLAPTGYYQVPTAPLINIDANAVLTIYADSKLQWNYTNSNGGAVYNAGKMIIRGGSDIYHNAVLADTYKGAGVYVKDGATLIVSDSITIHNNHLTYNDGSKAIVEKNSNVYLESVNSVIQVGTSQQNDGILALENHLTDGSGLKSAKIGVTKGTWGSNYYTPIAYSDGGGSAYLGNLIPENPDAVEAEDYIIYDDDEYYKVVTLNNTSPYEPSSDYLFWVGTWVTKVHEKPSTYTEGATVDIHNANDLAWAISVVNGLNDHAPAPNTNFNVVADIDMDANIWEPMGTSVHKYTGTFNANGHVISGIHSPLNNEYMGMFGYMNGTLQNMIVNVDFSGGNSITMGSVAAHMESGTISNVEAAGTITGTTGTETIGGIVAEKTAGSIHSSFAVNSITSANANAHVGGLVGNNAGDLFNSYANVTISGTGQIGGLAGKNNGTIENCYAVVDGQGFPAFAYENAEHGKINYCYADHDNGYVTNPISGSILQGHGTYSLPMGRKDFGYMYGDNAVTLVSGTSNYVHSDDIDYTDNHLINWNGLLWSLNKWVNQDATHSSTYTPWFRPTSNLINLDLPVLAFPQDNCLGTLDADGKYLAYGSTHNSANGLDNLLYYFNEDEVVNNAAASLFLYGNATAVTRVPESQVKVFVNEDACLLQADGAGDFINTTVGVTFDNSFKSATAWNDIIGTQTLTYDWHFLSSPLEAAPIGIEYTDEDTHNWWENQDNGQANKVSGSYFPNMTPTDDTWPTKWDIYTFYEPEYHWINLKRNSASHFHYDEPHNNNIAYTNETTFTPGKGYMMAIETDSYLSNTGTLTNKEVTVKATAQSVAPGIDEKGCNLLGNPYQAYFDLQEFFNENGMNTAWVYIAESDNYVPYPAEASSNPVLPSRYLHPHQGFFVKVTSDKTLTFNTDMATTTENNSYYRGSHENYPLVNLFAYNEAGQRDFVVVEFNRPEKGGATKMTAQRRAPFTLAAQDGQDEYTILFNDQNTKRVPIRFATTEDGTYTMQWETYHGTFNKLLLIDNITGTTCDMTTNDHYTFEGRATDFANRFYLVVNATDVDEFDADGDYNNFAYFNGSEWIVNGEGQLDLVDMTGRVLYSKYLAGETNSVSFGNVAAGVYVIRFGNKAQKIIIR